MAHDFFGILTLLYLGAFFSLLLYWRYLSYTALRAARWILGFGVVLHCGYLVSWFLSQHLWFPTNSWESQLLISACLGLFSWILILRKSYVFVDLFLIPIVLMGLTIFHFWGRSASSSLEISPWLWSHILLALVGEALFFIGAIISAAYLFVETQLRRRGAGSFFSRYPALPDFDFFLSESLLYGFICLSLGLVIGVLFADIHWTESWYFDPKVLMAVLTWIFYAIFLFFRWRNPSLRGRRSAWFSIVGAVVVVFLSIGLDHLVPSRHSFPSTDSSREEEK